MGQRLTYRSRARRTMSDRVSPLACALSKAACHRSSGMRMARGVSGIGYLPSQCHDVVSNVSQRPWRCFPVRVGFATKVIKSPTKIVKRTSAICPTWSLKPTRSSNGLKKTICSRCSNINSGAATSSLLNLSRHSSFFDKCNKSVKVDGCHGASCVGVCIYRLRPAVYTSQGHSRESFWGVA